MEVDIMKLPFDLLSKNYIKPKLYLCEVNKEKMCQLETISLNGSFKFNAYSELTFTVGRTYTNMTTGETQVNPFYDKIEALRLVYLEGFGYFEIQEPEIISDGIKEVKNVTAYGLEYRLSQRYLEHFKINTGEADSLEVIEANGSRIIPITLFNMASKDLSLLDLVLEKVYDWKIGHIDESLKTMSRQFDVSRASVYDFIVQDICEKFNCFAIFDTINNKINLYAEALITKHIGDGTSNTFIVSPPYDAVGTVTIDSYKTTQYIYDPVTGYLTFNEPPENGARIEITDGSQEKWQTDVYVSFDNLAQEVNISYSAEDIKTVLTVKGQDDLDIREVNMGLPYIVDLSYYYTVDWMGQDLYDAYTKYLQTSTISQTKYAKNAEDMLELTGHITYETQRLSLQYSIADNVTSTTVGTYYVRGGTAPDYYYKQVQLPDEYNASVEHYYMLSGSDLDEDKFSKLYAALQTYFVSQDKKDVEAIDKLKDSFEFMETNTLTSLSSTLSSATTLAQKDAAILNFFDEMFDQLGRVPLESLYLEPYKKIENTNKEAGWDDSAHNDYWRYYPVTLVIKSLEEEIKDRKSIIESYQEQYKALQTENNKIAQSTSIYNNFTRDQLVRLSPFLREDEYTDDNFLETDSDTIEILMKTKQELLECGKIELAKLCEPKLAFSMDMANIFALAEFEPIISQFQLGNLINVVIRPDYLKKARLLAVDINFDDFSDFSCEFGELTSLRTPSSIHADLLANALTAGNSVASNQSYWEKGADLATSTDITIHNGLLDAIEGIYNADRSVLIDNHGILLREVLDNGEYSPYQIWLTNNNILVSTDAFDTAQTGIGVFEVNGRELYGVLAKAVLSGYIEGSTIVGGTINIGDGTFTVDQFGNVTMKSVDLDGYVEDDHIISAINVSPENIEIQSNKISLTGKKINLTSDNITIDSTNFSVAKDGKITATSGEIAGWTIYPNLFRKETTVDGTDYQIYMQAADGADNGSNAFVVRKKNVNDSSWDYQFAVNYQGKLTAKNADITGAITATSLSLGNNVKIPYSKVSNTPDLSIYISKDGVVGSTPSLNSTGFKVSSKGLLTASNAVIYGTLYSSAGEIGGWTIYDNLLRKSITIDDVDYQMYMQAADGTNTSNAFAVRKRNSGDTSWDTQFAVNYSGRMTAKNANITGTITATDGEIAGYNIGPGGSYGNALYKRVSGDGAKYEVGLKASSGDTDLAFYVKKSTDNWGSSSNIFYVNNSGKLYAQNVDITGEVNASSGNISGNLNISGALINTKGDYTVTLRGVQSDAGKGVFYITDNSSGSAEYPVRINGDGSARFTNVTITGSSTIASACIPNLSATKITAGTLDVDRIPNISASKITSGTISTDRLSSSVITTGNFSSKSLTTGNINVTSGGNIGSWNVTSSGSLYAVSGNVGVGLSAYGLSAGSGGSTPWVNVLMAGQNASDQRLKKNINVLNDTFDNIFDNLNPVQFEYSTESLSKGIHLGYLAQDVIKSFEDVGENIENYSFVYEAAMEADSTETYYQLNKAEFIALNTWQIQKLKARIAELENRLDALERNDTK